MKSAFAHLAGRYITGSRTQRWPFVFTFVATTILPGDKLQTFALDDDYSFGVLQSITHTSWYQAKAARLKNEVDYNYSTESVFETFPWPQTPSAAQVEAVAAAGREVRRIRAEALPKMKGGLRTLYRTLELPGANPLKDAHATLDAAVLAAYGFSAKGDLLAQLLALNVELANKLKRRESVTAPGIPSGFSNPGTLITKDCIGEPIHK